MKKKLCIAIVVLSFVGLITYKRLLKSMGSAPVNSIREGAILIPGKFDANAIFPQGGILPIGLTLKLDEIDSISKESFQEIIDQDDAQLAVVKVSVNEGAPVYRVYDRHYFLEWMKNPASNGLDPVTHQPIKEVWFYKMSPATNSLVYVEKYEGEKLPLVLRALGGDQKAMILLGLDYYDEKDFIKARELLQKVVEQGISPEMQMYFVGPQQFHSARVALAYMYREGKGGPQDYAKAREIYEQNAVDGDTRAMIELVSFYFFGRGVAQDYEKAREWAQRAADRGSAGGKALLAVIYYKQGNYEMSRAWAQRAADAGNAHAKAALRLINIFGMRVVGSYITTMEWYEYLKEKMGL